MYAMVLSARGERLTFQQRPDPVPGPGEVRVKVSACGVCRTDLHVVDGELPDISYPIIPGHEVEGCQILSVANLTRKDGIDFLAAVAKINIQTHTTVFPLVEANEALACLREGKLTGAAVLRP